MKVFFILVARDLKLAMRQGGGTLTGVIFLLGLTLLLPLSLGPDPQFLARVAPAMVWIGALLTSLLSLDRLFQADDEDGTLDLLLLSGSAIEALSFAKTVAHWLSHTLPLVILSPLFGLMLGLETNALCGLGGSLLIGTPALTSLGALGAALTLNLRRGGLLLPVLVLPLTLPLLLFGVLSAQSAGTFPVLAGLSLLAVAFSPFAIAGALKASRS